MPTTTNILLSTPAHGANVDTWDADPINNNSAILDAVAGSVTTKSLTNANVTLTTTESRVNILRFSGTLTGSVIITLGAVIKSWTCENTTLGAAFTILMQGSPGTGNKVALPLGSCQIYWDGTNVSFINLGRVGEWWDYPGTAVPAWIGACTVPPYLHANGGTFSAVTYPQLNQILGGTTLPDTRGRARIPLDGGTGRVTTAGSNIDGSVLFAAGGQQSATLTTDHMPVHSHGVTDSGHVHPGIPTAASVIGTVTAGGPPNYVSGNGNSGSNTTGITIQNAGGGGAHINMQPTYVGGITMIRAA